MCKSLLTDFKRSSIVIPDNILKFSPGNISFHGAQMEKSLIVRCVPWCIRRREHGIKLHGNKGSVDHGIFGRTGMDINTLESYLCAAGIEVFVLDLAFRISIQGVGIICTEFFYIKVSRPHANLFIRCKSNTERPMRDFFHKDMLQRCDDFCDSCLVICAQNCGSV